MQYSKELKELAEYSQNKKISNIVRYNPNIITKLMQETSFLPENINNSERLWYVFNNRFFTEKCSLCKIKIAVYDWKNKTYKKYCKICSKKSPECLSKRHKTWLNKYGTISPGKEKRASTKLEKYNHSNWVNSEKIKETWKNKSEKELNEISNKIKQTKLKKYGNKNYNNINKIKQTNLERHGGLLNGSDIIRAKSKKTMLEKYGVEYFNNRPLHKQTALKNYHRRFVEISNSVHANKYKYFTLSGAFDKIEIECPDHGIFKQRMYSHMTGHGCPKCANSGFSQKAIEWLEHISEIEGIYIQHALNEGEYRIPGTLYHVDGFCKETNTCYEFLGDVWHGNIEIFKENKVVHPYEDISVKECYKETMKRLKEIKNLGYNIEYIWENDWR